jgi:dipeptidyl aminopeptidase/acylaminoacyl peptidase
VAAIPLAGVLDLVAGASERLGNGAIQDFLGGEPGDVPERYAAASPFALVPSPVPHIIIHGDEDDIVPFSQSGRFVSAMVEAGGTASLVSLPGAGHFDVIDPGSPAWPAVRDAILKPLILPPG